MNCNNKLNQWRRWGIGSLTAAALFVALVSSAQMATVEVHGEDGKRSVVSANQIVITDGDDESSHTVVIRVEDDKVQVISDGVEVPHAQLLHEDGKVIITDKDGNRIHTMGLKIKPGLSGFSFGDSEGVWARAAEPAPKVMLGVQMTEPGRALEKHLRLDPGTATMISGVYEGLPAHQAGIAEFDIITKVNGSSPADNQAIRKVLAEGEPGSTVKFTVIQEGAKRDVTIKLAAYDREALNSAKYLGSGGDQMWGRFSGLLADADTPMWQGSHVFVAPDLPLTQRMELMPHIQGAEGLSLRLHEASKGDIEARLQALDKRLAELDKTIQKLIEQRMKER
jgi:hypothetical protein